MLQRRALRRAGVQSLSLPRRCCAVGSSSPPPLSVAVTRAVQRSPIPQRKAARSTAGNSSRQCLRWAGASVLPAGSSRPPDGAASHQPRALSTYPHQDSAALSSIAIAFHRSHADGSTAFLLAPIVVLFFAAVFVFVVIVRPLRTTPTPRRWIPRTVSCMAFHGTQRRRHASDQCGTKRAR